MTLPLAWPATLAAAALVFIFCFTSFGVILFLAPAPDFATLEVEIYRLTERLLQLDAAAVLALVQLLVVGLVSWLYTWLQARMAAPLLMGREPAARRPRPVGRLLLTLNLVVIGALVLAPLVVLTLRSLTAPGATSSAQFPTLANFSGLLDAPRTLQFSSLQQALGNSLLFAGLSTGLALLVGFAFAYAVARGGWRLLDQLSLLPLALSPITLALGYLLTYPLLISTFWGVPLAHALVAFPFVTRTLLPAMRAMPDSQLGAATSLGAGPWRTLWRVELPSLAPSLLVAAAFAFAISIGEFGATLLLARPENATLPLAIFDRLRLPGAANYGAALALATILMLVTTLVMMLLQRRSKTEF